MRILLAAILVFCSVPASLAGVMSFDVSLSGTSNLGNTLTVFGTLKVDPDLPINNSNIGPFNLFVQRNSETPVRSLSFIALAIPNDTLGAVQMEWSVLDDELFVTRTSEADSSVTYVGLNFTAPQQPSASFNFGSGAFDHTITYGDASGLETTVLKGASGPDGPNGFLVSVAAVAISAPSSLLLSLTGACLLGGFVRRQRTQQ